MTAQLVCPKCGATFSYTVQTVPGNFLVAPSQNFTLTIQSPKQDDLSHAKIMQLFSRIEIRNEDEVQLTIDKENVQNATGSNLNSNQNSFQLKLKPQITTTVTDSFWLTCPNGHRVEYQIEVDPNG